MPERRRSTDLPEPGALRYAAASDLGDILITMPAGPRLPEVIVNKVDAFLQWRFPLETFAIAPGRPDADHGFMVIPMAGVICENDEIRPLPMPSAARLNEIADALEEFRAAGWKRRMN